MHQTHTTNEQAQRLSYYFTPDQLQMIEQPFDVGLLKSRPGARGRSYAFAEIDVITEMLNYIIGVDRWGYQSTYVREIPNEYVGQEGPIRTLTAIVEGEIYIDRLPTAPPGEPLRYKRIGTNTSEWKVGNNPREAMATCAKGGDSDALKRAAATIGPAFDPKTAQKPNDSRGNRSSASDQQSSERQGPSRQVTRSQQSSRQRPAAGKASTAELRSDAQDDGGNARQAEQRRSASAYVKNLCNRLEHTPLHERQAVVDGELPNIEQLPERARGALDLMLEHLGASLT